MHSLDFSAPGLFHVNDIRIDTPHEMRGVFKTPGAKQASTKQKDRRICRGSVPVDLEVYPTADMSACIHARTYICLLDRMLSCHYCILCVPRTVHRIPNPRPLSLILRKDTTLLLLFLIILPLFGNGLVASRSATVVTPILSWKVPGNCQISQLR